MTENLDHRLRQWRVIVRVYTSLDDFAEPAAESDPLVFDGLPLLAQYMNDVAAGYNTTFSEGVLSQRITIMRTCMSRKKSHKGTLRLECQAADGLRYLFRADVERLDVQ